MSLKIVTTKLSQISLYDEICVWQGISCFLTQVLAFLIYVNRTCKILFLGTIKPYKLYIITVYPLYSDGQGEGESTQAYLQQDGKFTTTASAFLRMPQCSNWFMLFIKYCLIFIINWYESGVQNSKTIGTILATIIKYDSNEKKKEMGRHNMYSKQKPRWTIDAPGKIEQGY